MAVSDSLLTLSGTYNPIAGQLVTATGNTTSTNIIDTEVGTGERYPQVRDFGVGKRLSVEISILQTLTSAGGATVQFQLVQADDAAISVNVNVVASTDAYD